MAKIYDAITETCGTKIRWTNNSDGPSTGEAKASSLGFIDGLWPSCLIVRGRKERKMFINRGGDWYYSNCGGYAVRVS